MKGEFYLTKILTEPFASEMIR